MKKLISIIALSLFLYSLIAAQENDNKHLGDPIRAYLNLNNISTIFWNDGRSDNSMEWAASFVFPKTTGKTAVYISGLILGANINEPLQSDPHIGGSAYRTGLQGGRILPSGLVEDPDASHVRIYRVRPDVYPIGPTVDLSVEAQYEMKSVSEIRAQYESDWVQWRGNDGAPFNDVNENGFYDPSIDVPGILGAVQTIWFVANDQSATKTNFFYFTQPIGLEYQATYWEYKDSLGLDNLYFRKYKLINKTDVLGDPKTFQDMYISMWSDPDIGNIDDDFVGCDTLLDLGFAYNASDTDFMYQPLTPPAVGFDLIRGPLVQGIYGEDRNRNGVDDYNDFGLTEDNEKVYGYINLPMTAFYYYTGEDSVLTDPSRTSAGAPQFYNFMQGEIGKTGEQYVNPITGLPTTFALSGNPVTGEGWIDGMQLVAGDRKLGLSTGPLQMAPGDTQVVVVAVIAAGANEGIDYLSAIDTVKKYSQIAQKFYDTVFPITDTVTYGKVFPQRFELKQNFPNPFNLITKINYQIPKFSFVTLKVYDVLGSEIVTLVTEEKPTGSYEIEFNAAGLPSGIYFYRLQAGSFIETKKMILMK